MQQRRGTASQWNAADPVLGAGEIGFETDTGEFRVGDGISLWSELSPFKNIVDLGGNLDDYIPLTLIGANDGVAGLDSTGQVSATNLAYVATYVNGVRTTIDADIATAEDNAIASANTYTDSAILTEVGNRNTAIDTAKNEAIAAAQTAQANAETTAAGYVSDHATDTTNVHGISDTAEIATKTYADDAVGTHNTDTTGVHGITDTSLLETTAGAQTKADLAQGAAISFANATFAPKDNPTFTGTISGVDLSITGDLTVGGTTTTVNATDLVVTDPLIYIGEGNTSNVVDLGFVASYNDGTYHHAGLARDASDNKWKLFSSVEDEPTTTINFSQAEYDTLKLGAVEFSDGTQTKQGVPSITPISSKTGSYTLALTDRDTLIEFASYSTAVITIPADSSVNFPVGTSIDVLQTYGSPLSIEGAAGVTVNATPGLKLRAQWSSATLFKRAANTWVVFGDLSA